MKKIFSLFNFESFKINLVNVINRFLFPFVLLIILITLFFFELHLDLGDIESEYIYKLIFSIIITFFLSLGLYLTAENLGLSKSKQTILQLIALLFGTLFCFYFKKNLADLENVIYCFLTGAGIISFLFISPYIRKLFTKDNFQNIYYSYFYKLSVVFLISTILGGVLFGLGSIGISAVFALFDLRDILSDKIYGDWAIISLSLITPIFALTKIPEKETFGDDNFTENIFFSFLVKYIAIPFIYIYFIILYTYSIKVLSNFKEWPKGEVTWLVTGFSIFGYLIYMFSYIFDEKLKFIKLFRKLFPFFVVPQLFMLFYAIYLRINQYDITINRYFVVIFGVWLAVISLYLIVSKKKLLAYIPFILTIFTIIISIGPWGVYSLPESRQLSRLEKNLEKAGILKNGEIIPLKNYEDISQDLSKDIYTGIDYLCDFDNCQSIKKLFKKQYEKVLEQNKLDWLKNGTYGYIGNDELSSYQIVSGITEEIKVKSYFNDYGIYEPDTISFNIQENGLFPIDIKGYSKILSTDYITNGTGEHIEYNHIKQTLEYKDGSTILDNIDLKQFISDLKSKYIKNKNTNLEKNKAIFEAKTTKGEYKIIIKNIGIDNPLYKGKKSINGYYDISGYVLIK